jgi:dihydropteroate synthase
MDLAAFLAGRSRPAVMGILNVTPDSFSDGGLYFTAEAAVERGRRIAREGADWLDVGGESTRPPVYGSAQEVPADEEIRRTAPVVEALARELTIPISIDTRKAAVAAAALCAGATIVNDVTAFRFDPSLADLAAETGAGVVLMHMRGTDPRTMQQGLPEGDAGPEVSDFLAGAAAAGVARGIAAEKIAIDPGLGFGKTDGQNRLLLSRLSRLRQLGFPLVVGASRKGFVRRLSGADATPAARLAASLACGAVAAEEGAAAVRVHDVAATVALLDAIAAGASLSQAARAAGAELAPFSRAYGALRGAASGGFATMEA